MTKTFQLNYLFEVKMMYVLLSFKLGQLTQQPIMKIHY